MVSQDMDSVSIIKGTKEDKNNFKGSFFEEDLKRNLQSLCDAIIEGSLLTSSHHLFSERKWVKNDDVRRVAVIIALQKHSSGKFDCITRTKMVKNLMSEIKTESGCTLFIQNLISMFLDED